MALSRGWEDVKESSGASEQVANKSQEDMMKVRNLGKKSLDEVTNKLIALGLGFTTEEE